MDKLSDKDLSIRYLDIHTQSQLFKGLILLEARRRYPSNKEFHNYLKTHGLLVDSQPTRNLFMQLANFFQERAMDGILLTAAYLIASPKNHDIAEEVYKEVFRKNYSVNEVKKIIDQKRTSIYPDESLDSGKSEEKEICISQDKVDLMLTYARSLYSSKAEILELLKCCIKKNMESNN